MNVQVHRHRGMSRSMMRCCGHVFATRRHGRLHHTRGSGRVVTREHGPPMETRCTRHRRGMLQLEGSVTSAGTTDDTTPGCASGTSAASAVHPPPFHHECRWYLRRVADISRTLFRDNSTQQEPPSLSAIPTILLLLPFLLPPRTIISLSH